MYKRSFPSLLSWLWLWLWYLMAPTCVAVAQAPDTLEVTLASVLERAVEASPDLDAARARLAYAEARGEEARAGRFLTDFSATSGHSVVPALLYPNDIPLDALYLDPGVRNDWSRLRPYNELRIELVQPLYTFGEIGGLVQAANHGVGVEQAAVERASMDVALRAAELYYNVLLANELFRLAERTKSVVDRAATELDSLLAEGKADDADVFQLQITREEFNQRVVEVTQKRLTARVALARQLLLEEGVVVVPEADLLRPLDFQPEPLETYLSRAIDARPELAQARSGLDARSALVDVARSAYYPKLFAGLSTHHRYAGSRPRQRNPFISNPYVGKGFVAGLGMRLQLNFSRTRAKVRQSEAQLAEVRAQLVGAQQLVLFEVERAYRELLSQEAALRARDESLRLSKEWLRVEYINFDLDLGSTENLVKAVRENLSLEARYFEAVQAYNMAVLRLLHVTGVLATEARGGTILEHVP